MPPPISGSSISPSRADDIEADIARLEKLGAQLQEGPLTAPNGVRFAFLGVPDDVRVELLQLPK